MRVVALELTNEAAGMKQVTCRCEELESAVSILIFYYT